MLDAWSDLAFFVLKRIRHKKKENDRHELLKLKLFQSLQILSGILAQSSFAFDSLRIGIVILLLAIYSTRFAIDMRRIRRWFSL